MKNENSICGHLRFDPRKSAFKKGGEKEMKKNGLGLGLGVVAICMLLLLFTPAAEAAGLAVDPGAIEVKNVPLGKVVRVSELTGEKLRIKNKGSRVSAYTISILKTKETTSKLQEGYEDIPKTDWIWPEKEEIQIAGNSIKEVELYLKIPKKKKYYGEKYQAIIEIKSKKDTPGDLFVLAVQPRICLDIGAKEKVRSKKEKGKSKKGK